MLRSRIQSKSNYASVFINGSTIRMPISDTNKEITELEYPEFYDIGINTKCLANCSFCYTDAKVNGVNFENVVDKIQKFFGSMTQEQRPFQIALGGSGEATLHPEFIEVLKTFDELGIVPNYTTNAMHLTEEVLDATKQYCGGVAVSLHPHLVKVWRKGIDKLIERGIKTNVHIIISDKESIDLFKEIYAEYNGKIDYFVLLPYMAVGRATPKVIEYEYLEKSLRDIQDQSNIAFGANFYEFLKITSSVKVSLYPPEIMSKYLIFDDHISLYNNSFEMKPVAYNENNAVLI